MYDGLKNQQKLFLKLGQEKIFQKNFWAQNLRKTAIFGPKNGKQLPKNRKIFEKKFFWLESI